MLLGYYDLHERIILSQMVIKFFSSCMVATPIFWGISNDIFDEKNLLRSMSDP
jgi:hypothetical protein